MEHSSLATSLYDDCHSKEPDYPLAVDRPRDKPKKSILKNKTSSFDSTEENVFTRKTSIHEPTEHMQSGLESQGNSGSTTSLCKWVALASWAWLCISYQLKIPSNHFEDACTGTK